MLNRKTLFLTAAIATMAAAPALARTPSGTITISEHQFGFLIGGNTGGGVLRFHGRNYPFKIGGISVGDIGITKVRATGEVYDLKNIADFEGTYTKLDASATAGNGNGELRLKKGDTELDLHIRSKGLQLSAGAGGVKITMK